MSVRVRFAPSPTGKLHVGNIRAAALNWLFARQKGGQFVLRLDDTDTERSTEAFADGIRADMGWLGLVWDETFRQSDRLASYDAAVAKLKASGHLYPCYESAEELDMKRKLARAAHRPPIYDRAALKLSEEKKAELGAAGVAPHWRFKLDHKRVSWNDLIRGEQSVDLASVSDPILVRADGSYLYTLPSVVDDVDSGITHVIRGEDHVTNAGVQLAIFEALGAKVPEFAHFPLIAAMDGEGLSKRTGSLSIESLREDGIEPLAILSLLARLGTGHAQDTVGDEATLVAELDFGHFSRATAKFDPAQLEALSAKILHEEPFDRVKDRLPATITEPVWEALKHNISKIAELADWLPVVEGPIAPVIEDAELLAVAATLLPDDLDWKAWTRAVQDATGKKGRALFHPLRLALTARDQGPEMARLLPLIGRARILKRLAGEEA